MSKRSKILIAAGAPLLLVIALAILWVVLGRFGALDPVFTDERPTNRPIRLDHRLLERFSAQPVGEILETLQREASLMPPPAPATPAIVPFPPLLAMLPDAPLPYPESAAPRDAEGIKKFVTEMQQDTSEDPTDEERRQFNLALAALHVNPEKVPEAIRVDVRPTLHNTAARLVVALGDRGVVAVSFQVGVDGRVWVEDLWPGLPSAPSKNPKF